MMIHKKHIAEKIAELTELILEAQKAGHLIDYLYLQQELEKAIDQYTACKTNSSKTSR